MWELDYKECWVLKNWWFWTVVLEKTLKSPLDRKEIQPVHPKGNQSWIFIRSTDTEVESSNTLSTWYKEPTHWKTLWCWERLRAGEKEGDRGWDGSITSPIQWTWTQANSERQRGRGKLGMLQSKGLQRVRHNLVNEWQKQCLQGNPPVSQQQPTFQVAGEMGLSPQGDLVSLLFTATYPLWF